MRQRYFKRRISVKITYFVCFSETKRYIRAFWGRIPAPTAVVWKIHRFGEGRPLAHQARSLSRAKQGFRSESLVKRIYRFGLVFQSVATAWQERNEFSSEATNVSCLDPDVALACEVHHKTFATDQKRLHAANLVDGVLNAAVKCDHVASVDGDGLSG